MFKNHPARDREDHAYWCKTQLISPPQQNEYQVLKLHKFFHFVFIYWYIGQLSKDAFHIMLFLNKLEKKSFRSPPLLHQNPSIRILETDQEYVDIPVFRLPFASAPISIFPVFPAIVAEVPRVGPFWDAS